MQRLYFCVPTKCTDLDVSLFYILTLGTHSKFAPEKKNSSARRLLSTALLERWPQVCRVQITFTKLLTNCSVSTTKKWIKCVINWISLRIWARLTNTQLYLKGRSDPDCEQKQKQSLYQNRVCTMQTCDHLWHLWRSQNVTISKFGPRLFFWIFWTYMYIHVYMYTCIHVVKWRLLLLLLVKK